MNDLTNAESSMVWDSAFRLSVVEPMPTHEMYGILKAVIIALRRGVTKEEIMTALNGTNPGTEEK